MKKLKVLVLIIVLCLVIVTTGSLEIEDSNKKEETITTSQWSYSGAYTILISGNEKNWVESIGIINGNIITTAKSEEDRTYQKCINWKSEFECIEWKEEIYEVPDYMPVAKGDNINQLYYDKSISYKEVLGKRVFEYQMTGLKVYKLGMNSIIIIPDFITNASLVNMTAEKNFTHLNISKISPYDELELDMHFDTDTSSTTVYDYTSRNRDGAITGNAHFVTDGKYGGAMSFDRDEDYIEFGKMDMDTWREITGCAWVSWDETAGDEHTIMSNWGASSILFRLEPSDNAIELFVNAPFLGGTFPDSTIDDSNWHHVCFTYDTTTLRVYLDSVVSSTTFVGPALTGLGNSIENFAIGTSLHAGTPGGDYFNGRIDNVMIFKKGLTGQEILDIYINESEKFVPTGTHSFRENFSEFINKITVTGEFQNLSGSSIDLEIFFENSSGWFSAGSQSYVGDNTYMLSSTKNVSLNFTLNSGAFGFDSPLLLGENGITLDTRFSCDYVNNSGDYNCNQECIIINKDYNVSDGTNYVAVRMFDGCSLNLINSTIISNKRSTQVDGDLSANFNLTESFTWRFVKQ